jgi:hypothetical protein
MTAYRTAVLYVQVPGWSALLLATGQSIVEDFRQRGRGFGTARLPARHGMRSPQT